MGSIVRRCAPLAATTLALAIMPATAATLMVGPGQTYALPSQAAQVAHPGDTIIIEPSTYVDCSVWTASNITIEASATGVVIENKICQGKAIFVIPAGNVTINGITFQGAKASDGNGAGIRAEGPDLTIENSRFIDNQDGILAAANLSSTITITNSEFDHNGACINNNSCAHGIYINQVALLSITNTRFYDTQVGHHIKSRAENTTITGCDIEDGPNGTSSYLVDLPNGGNFVMSNTTLEKGPKSQNHGTAISIGEEGVNQPTNQLLVEDNTFTNDGPKTVFVRNLTSTSAQLIGNVFKGNPTIPLVGDGTIQ